MGIKQFETFRAQGTKRHGGSASFTMKSLDFVLGSLIFFIFNSSLTNPTLYLSDRDAEMLCNLIFVHIVGTNKVTNLVKKLTLFTCRAYALGVAFRQRAFADFASIEVVK